ncbi:PhzF family phenazine biosynthesis protein [Vreelandella zhanjiangensis]|uniref:PhzF family phenazine biosynthesis protein n=1 Tax=Vreelandella zhanjiangensis TaxID=1121960 RepID=UPI0003A0AC42|nr:PhzF family phenazine biosynthesis isomerase [Halomonas zhanjiangensis]
MKIAEYYLLDVFTRQPFAGNQLAVFLNTDGLPAATMQAIANELNLAETVFLSAPIEPNHYPMRIFTPTQELPFAGHPTVGTAQLLAELGLINRTQTLVLHPPVGELSIHYSGEKAVFTTARPASITPSTLDQETAAALLGLQSHHVVGTNDALDNSSGHGHGDGPTQRDRDIHGKRSGTGGRSRGAGG